MTMLRHLSATRREKPKGRAGERTSVAETC